MKWAYYNEFDSGKAAWLRELIKRGLIAEGEVDERSIQLVQPADVRAFRQCHWFAGISVWSYALRCAGWADDRAIWTASCPCPPFSAAGKKKKCPACAASGRSGEKPNIVPHVGRTGVFVCCTCGYEWLADSRHLYPELFRLIRDRRPSVVIGEQVGGPDGNTWMSLVRASLEILRYTPGATNTPAAGYGAFQIRQRLYWMARRNGNGLAPGSIDAVRDAEHNIEPCGGAMRMARASAIGCERGRASEAGGVECADEEHETTARDEERAGDASGAGALGGLADSHGARLEERQRERGNASEQCAPIERDRDAGGMECAEGDGREQRRAESGRRSAASGRGASFWSECDWVLTRPQRLGDPPSLRPVERSPQPLADGAAGGMVRGGDRGFPLAEKQEARTLRLKGYGDAIVAPQAIEFIRFAMECL